jgi:hypothetical protein
MQSRYSLQELIVIGCTEVPVRAPALPRLLSPIFLERTGARVFFPPYLQDGDAIYGPTVYDKEEFDDLVACGEITGQYMGPAKSQWDLWMDDEGKIGYERASDIKAHLSDIFKKYCSLAESAYLAGDWRMAQAHSLFARSANTRNLDPLIIRAAAETKMGHFEQRSFTDEIASDMISIEYFKCIVANWIKTREAQSPSCSTAWVTWEHDQCDNCGGLAEIQTKATKGYAYDGDEARCTECGMPGGICCDSESPAVIMWHDEPACKCEWCQANYE